MELLTQALALMVTTKVGPVNDPDVTIAIQTDGKIVAAELSFNEMDYDFALVRYKTDGTLDSTFGSDGKVTSAISSGDDEVYSVKIQPDGRIIAAGSAGNYPYYAFALARYLSVLNVGIINLSSSQSSPLIYPNPIHQNETLEYTLTKNESITIALLDANGKLVQSFITNGSRTAGDHKEQLNLNENLSAGNYLLSLNNGIHNISVKLVKQ